MPAPGKVEEILNDFAERMSGLMIDHYQRHLAELELTLPQAQALRILRRGAMTTGRLAEELGISAPALTQASCRRAQPLFVFPTNPATGLEGGVSLRCQIPGRRRSRERASRHSQASGW